MTQSQIILAVLKTHTEWVPSYDLQKARTAFGWLGTGADRIARGMALQGLILRKRIGKYTWYKSKDSVGFGCPKAPWREEKRKLALKQLEEAGQARLTLEGRW